MIHATAQCRSGLAGLRDLKSEDIEAIVDYWHGGGADLVHLGIDLSRLGTPDDMRLHYRSRIRTGDKAQRAIGYAITLDCQFVGYTYLNQYAPDSNYSHWHITKAGMRAGGITSALYPHRIKMYFDTTDMNRLVHQTRTRNVGVNRVLNKYVPVVETLYIDRPDGFAGPGEFHIRYVYRTDVPRLFDIAAQRNAASL